MRALTSNGPKDKRLSGDEVKQGELLCNVPSDVVEPVISVYGATTAIPRVGQFTGANEV